MSALDRTPTEETLRKDLWDLHLRHQFERRNGEHLRRALREIHEGGHPHSVLEDLVANALDLEKKRRRRARKDGIL